MKTTVLLLAGEASGDEHGAALARALHARRPGLRLAGTGGDRMAAAGVDLMAGLDELAVMGVFEVLPRLPYLRRLARRIEGVMDEGGVGLVVPIDFPGFNLRMARAAHDRGIRVLYYIAPKVWASRPGRARELAATTDRVAAILPFEERVLKRAGVRAEYVGHPLLDRPHDPTSSADFRARWDLDPHRPLLALLPGSREQEIDRHLELFCAAAERVTDVRPDVLPVVSRARTVAPARFGSVPWPVVDDTRGLLEHASLGLVKSGTSTLEAALADTPMVVAYRTSPPTWLLARALLRVDHVSLPNLIADAPVVPEHLQGSATAPRLADSLLSLLDEGGEARRAQLEGFDAVRRALGAPGTSDRVADLAVGLMTGDA